MPCSYSKYSWEHAARRQVLTAAMLKLCLLECHAVQIRKCLSTFRRFLASSFLKSFSPSFLTFPTVYTVQCPEDQSLYEIVPSIDQHCFLPLLPHSIFLPQKVLWIKYLAEYSTRVVVGLLTGHNTLIRHLHVMGLSNDPTCRKCGTEEETSVQILCECEALASLRHQYLGSFFLDPEDIRVLGVGAIWNFIKGTGLL